MHLFHTLAWACSLLWGNHSSMLRRTHVHLLWKSRWSQLCEEVTGHSTKVNFYTTAASNRSPLVKSDKCGRRFSHQTYSEKMNQSVYKLYKKINVEDTWCYLNMHNFVWYFIFLIKKNDSISVPNRYTKSTGVVRNQGPTITTKEKNLLVLIFISITCSIRHYSFTFTYIKISTKFLFSC